MHHSVRSSRNYSWLWCGHIFLHGELCTIHIHSSCMSWWVYMAAAFKNQSIRLPLLYLISHLNQIRCRHSLLKEIVQAWQLPQASSKLWHRCKPSSSALDFFNTHNLQSVFLSELILYLCWTASIRQLGGACSNDKAEAGVLWIMPQLPKCHLPTQSYPYPP